MANPPPPAAVRSDGVTYDAVIFDCDGVLVNSEEIVVSVERRLLAEVGLEFEFGEYISRFMGLSLPDYFTALDAERRARTGEGLPRDVFDRITDQSEAAIERDLIAVDGIADLLDGLDRPRAVASSSHPEGLVKKLEITDLLHRFDPHVYSTALVANGKPAPDIFLLAAERLATSPAGCVVIEDSVNGVRAAVAAGMSVLGFTGGGHADDGLAGRLHDAGAVEVFDTHHAIARRLAG